MDRLVAALSAGLLLAGCASQQLNSNALDLAATVGYLQSEQVLSNLALFIANPDAIPAQVALSSGIVQVNNTLNPTWTYPYDFLKTAANALGTSARDLHLGYTNQWVENWNLAPVSDSEDLKRLRALYRYAVYGDVHDCAARCSAYDFEAEYGATFIRDVQGHPRPIKPVPRIHDQIHTGWLYWSESGGGKPVLPSPPTSPVFPIGAYGDRTLYTTSRGYFSDFIIAVQGASVQTRAQARIGPSGPLLNP